MQIPGIQQCDFSIAFHQQRCNTATKGITENDQFTVGGSLGIVDGQQRRGTGEIDIVESLALHLAAVVDLSGAAAVDMGHVQIDTTMQYAMENQNNVKISHRKFIG